MSKYGFTGKTTTIQTPSGDIILKQIYARHDMDTIGVHCSEPGGWIEKEKNLSQKGLAWVHGDAMVYGNARVTENAQVHHHAVVSGNARICDDAIIYNNSHISGNTFIRKNAIISDNATITGDNVEISDYVMIRDNVKIEGNINIRHNAILSNHAEISGHVYICDDARIFHNAKIYGKTKISNNMQIGAEADICCTDQILFVGPIGSRNDYTTFYRGTNNNIIVICGCFEGTLSDFLQKVRHTHKRNKYAKVYRIAAKMAKRQIK